MRIRDASSSGFEGATFARHVLNRTGRGIADNVRSWRGACRLSCLIFVTSLAMSAGSSDREGASWRTARA